jgi:hypothetical protein
MKRIMRLAGAALLLAPSIAAAAPIGSAISVKPNAQSESERGTETLAVGALVETNDKIRTNAGGSTRLRFLDASTLDVGAGALVTLDSFVYNANRTAKEASLTMAKGAFRWVSGKSDKEAYDLKTPHATIGIRGTDIRVIAEDSVTTVRLNSGAIRVCSRVSSQCAEATRPGQGVRVHADGRVEELGAQQLQQQQQTPPPTRRASRTPPPDDTPPPPRRSGPRNDRGGPTAPPPRRVVIVDEDDAPPPRRRIPPRRVVVIEDEPIYPAYPPPRGPSAGEVIGGAIAIGIGIAGSQGGFRPPRRTYPTHPGPSRIPPTMGGDKYPPQTTGPILRAQPVAPMKRMPQTYPNMVVR